MRTPLERILIRLSPSERMAVLIAAITCAAMVSAVAADRLLQPRPAPVVIAVEAPAALSTAYPLVQTGRTR